VVRPPRPGDRRHQGSCVQSFARAVVRHDCTNPG
jgi:hypothetical protein